jgi:RNase P protein component
VDVVVIPRRELLKAPYSLLEADVRRALQRGAAQVTTQDAR